MDLSAWDSESDPRREPTPRLGPTGGDAYVGFLRSSARLIRPALARRPKAIDMAAQDDVFGGAATAKRVFEARLSSSACPHQPDTSPILAPL